MNLRQLEHFVALAETGSFSRAAAQQHVTQPALSRSIQSLETELEGLLIDRVGKKNELTPLGFEVLERAKLVLFEATELKRTTRLMAEGAPSSMRVGFGSGPGAVLTVPFLSMMARRHPATHVVIGRGTIESQLQALRQRQLDSLVIDTRSVVPATDLRIEQIAEIRGGFLCRRGHPLTLVRKPRFSDVLRYPFASSPMSLEVRRTLVSRYGAAADPDACTTLSCEDVGPLIELLQSSDAVFLGIVAAARNEMAAGTVVELKLSPPLNANATFGLITLGRRTEAPAMDLLRAFVRDHLRD